MNPFLLIAINALALVSRLKANGYDDKLKADYEALVAQLTPSLPPPPSGDVWTDEDLQALAAEHNAITAEIRNRHDGD